MLYSNNQEQLCMVIFFVHSLDRIANCFTLSFFTRKYFSDDAIRELEMPFSENFSTSRPFFYMFIDVLLLRFLTLWGLPMMSEISTAYGPMFVHLCP